MWLRSKPRDISGSWAISSRVRRMQTAVHLACRGKLPFAFVANVHDFPRIEKSRRKDSCCSLPFLIMGNKTHLKNCRASNVASATPNRWIFIQVSDRILCICICVSQIWGCIFTHQKRSLSRWPKETRITHHHSSWIYINRNTQTGVKPVYNKH